SNPFLDEPVGRPLLGRIALAAPAELRGTFAWIRRSRQAWKDARAAGELDAEEPPALAPGAPVPDTIGLAGVLVRLIGGDGAPLDAVLDPELRAVVEAALAGRYKRIAALGPVLASALRRLQARAEIEKVEARERAVRAALARAEEREREARRNLALTFLEKADRAAASVDWL